MSREIYRGPIKEVGIHIGAAVLAISAPVAIEQITSSIPQAQAQVSCEVQGLVTDYFYRLGPGHTQYDTQGRPIYQDNVDIIGDPAEGRRFDITALGRTVRLVIDGRGQGVDPTRNRIFADFVGQPDTTNQNQPAIRMTEKDSETGQTSSLPVTCNTGNLFREHTFQEPPPISTRESFVTAGVVAPSSPENPTVSGSLVEIEGSLKKFSDEAGAAFKAGWNYFVDEGHNPLAWGINGLSAHGEGELARVLKFVADNFGAITSVIVAILVLKSGIIGWGFRQIGKIGRLFR